MKEFPSVPPAATGVYEHAADTASRAVELTGDGTAKASNRPPAAAAESLPSIAGYTVVRKIGEGGMGAVYLAEDTRLGRKTAIKTMKAELAGPSDRDRFVREARAAAAVEHDNIVPVWQVGEAADGSPFIAMPFLQGEMLDDRLKRQPVANLGVVLKVALEVSAGLAAAHAKGLIHRDIKPGNIWLEGDLSAKEAGKQIRRCKILDFGLARSVDKDDAQITASGAILGTPAYMAPEQARGEKVDHRADLFSLGVMLYRMATGRLPFRGPNAMAVLIALATEAPPPVRELAPNLPPALADLIDRLMSKDPAARPQSAAEVSAAVRQIVKEVQAKKASGSASAVPVYVLPAPAANPWEEVTEADAEAAPVANPPKAAKRSRAPWFAVAGGVLLLLALVVVLAVVVIRVQTAEGTLVVEINDPAVEARIKDGKLVLIGTDGKEKYTITATERDKKIDAGAYTIRVEGADGLALDTREFTLKKGGQVTVRVTLDPKAVAKKKDDTKPQLKPTHFREVHGAGVAELEQWMKSIREDGFIPSYLSGEAGSSPSRFVAVAVPNPSKTEWRFMPRDDYATPEADRNWQAQAAAGFLHEFCCAHQGDSLHESNVWIAVEGRTWFGCGGNRNVILAKLKTLQADKVRPSRISAGPHKDWGMRYSVLMTPDGGRGWDAQLELTAAELPAVVAKHKDKGWRVEWLSACGKGAQLRFQAVFVEDPNGAGWDFQMGLTVKEYEQRLADAAKQKSRSLAVVGYDEGGQRRYAVVWLKGDAAANLAPDRKAAEYVLSIGGGGRVNEEGPEREIRLATNLPKDPFRLSTVNLWGNGKVTADGLSAFEGCRNVDFLWLNNSQVDDAGLAHLGANRGLTQLHLHNTPVTDKGLANFKGCTTLTQLNIGCTKVTAEGLSYFKDSPGITHLYAYSLPLADADIAVCARWAEQFVEVQLQSTLLTDAGMEHFKGCKSVVGLNLSDTQVGDAGIATFNNCENLARLRLTNTKVGDAGLASLTTCGKLTILHLSGTPVSDAGIHVLKQFTKLTELTLTRTKVTAKGVKELAKALPQCRIEWDGGVIEPAKK